jgi:hypothetical protein
MLRYMHSCEPKKKGSLINIDLFIVSFIVGMIPVRFITSSPATVYYFSVPTRASWLVSIVVGYYKAFATSIDKS